MARSLLSTLTPLLKLWLRSQVEHLDTLEIHIGGNLRQLWGGSIPEATVRARGVTYQGLHLTALDLRSSAIHLNIAQILRGESLRLLEPIEVTLSGVLSPTDLQHCWRSPLFQSVLPPHLAPLAEGAQDDASRLAVLQKLCHHLGDDFALEHLSLTPSGLDCRGAFTIRASP
ncbi:MAG: DUF2993 domain-containing protein [Oscillatoriales cyanobacterium SM2_2_1]|nr:DUF2993 domain-containing protein [Oscillatoriales cyanobacterium SM2_2_1]